MFTRLDDKGNTTRCLGTISVDESGTVAQFRSIEGVDHLRCHVSEVAKGTRDGRYAIRLASGSTRAVFTSEGSADRVIARCRGLRTACAQCGGDIAMTDVVDRQGCGHQICKGCYAENNVSSDGPGRSRRTGGTALSGCTVCDGCNPAAGDAGGAQGGCSGRPVAAAAERSRRQEGGAARNQADRRKRGLEQGTEEMPHMDEEGSRVPEATRTAAQRLTDIRDRVRKKQAAARTGAGAGGAVEGDAAAERGEEGEPAPATPSSLCQ